MRQPPEPTPEQIAAERARIAAVLAIDYPARKPGARTRMWEGNRRRAFETLRQLDAGLWRPQQEDEW